MLRTYFQFVVNRRKKELEPCVQGEIAALDRQKGIFGRRSGRSRRLGAAATEFACVAPVFFLMVIGFIEFGRALMVQQVLINASRVGARQASTTGATTAQVQSAVQNYTTGVVVNGVTATVTPDPATAVAGTTITVEASVPFSNVSWMPSAWFLSGKTLKASSQMRKEGFQ